MKTEPEQIALKVFYHLMSGTYAYDLMIDQFLNHTTT